MIPAFRSPISDIVFRFVFLIISLGSLQAGTDGITITFPSEDGLAVTADVYAPVPIAGRPVVVLFHQASYSRGEYCEIAPRLNELGFACIAVDQRSGNRINGVTNETAKLARSEGLGTAFEDALQDMRAALEYARSENGGAPVIGMGSSYSSSLILTIAADRPDLVDGTLSFSPGEYFSNKKLIETAAANVDVPAFITSARSEANNWSAIFEAIGSTDKVSFVPDNAGRHGASALWESTSGNAPTWEAVEGFLNQWLSPVKAGVEIAHELSTGNVVATLSGEERMIEASSDMAEWRAVASSPVQLTFLASKPGVFLRSREITGTTGGANVTAVSTSGTEGRYTFSVTISSPDTGCEQYADWWEVLDEEGELLYRRVLAHSHVTENPFTRSGTVAIGAEDVVWVRAHMNHSGYGGSAMRGSVASGFEAAELPTNFAPWAISESPLPDGCDF